MKAFTILSLLLLGTSSILADLSSALEALASYEAGQSKNVLHKARLATLQGTDNAATRTEHEKKLVAFIASDATPAARREACLWLGQIGTEASVPVLEKLTTSTELGGAARIALANIRGTNTTTPANATHKLARFRAAVEKGDNPAAILLDAIKDDDPDLAGLALQLVANGHATAEVVAALNSGILKIPAERQIRTLNILATLDSSQARPTIIKVAREGEGAPRLAAIRHMGMMGKSADLSLLIKLLSSDKDTAAASRDALIAMDAATFKSAALRILIVEDCGPELHAHMFEIAAARADGIVADVILVIAKRDGAANQTAAIRSLGRALTPDHLPDLIAIFLQETDVSRWSMHKKNLWDLARRHPDYSAVVSLFEKCATDASEKNSAVLKGISKKIKGMKTDPLASASRGSSTASASSKSPALIPTPLDDIIPERFEMLAHLDCGTKTETKSGPVTISRTQGASHHSGTSVPASLSLDFHTQSVEYSVSGLDPKADYILGMTWWDIDMNGRTQELTINGNVVLPEARPIGYDENRPTPARIQFALLPKHMEDGKLNIAIRKISGPNAVNSELWILKRKRPAAEKQVLLISGQDYPAHHWRKTGPLVAKAIAADERMEVTICESPYTLSLDHLAHYDAVFIHFKNYDQQLPSTLAMRDGLKRYMRNGGGMCLSHFACGALEEWPDFVKYAGRVWNGQGHDRKGPFTVNIVDKEHSITRGLSDFQTDDELYFCLKGDPEVHLLCDAFSKVRKARHPQALVMESGEGRTFLCTLGHDLKAYEADAVKTLYRQGTAWVARLEE